MCQGYHVRPSDLLRVSDSFVAFAVDRAVWTFAAAIEQDQEDAVRHLPKNAKETTHNHVRQRVLDSYLGIDPTTTPGRFRDPGNTRRR